MELSKEDLEILSEALDWLNYHLDMDLSEDDIDYMHRRELTKKLQNACALHDRVFANLAMFEE